MAIENITFELDVNSDRAQKKLTELQEKLKVLDTAFKSVGIGGSTTSTGGGTKNDSVTKQPRSNIAKGNSEDTSGYSSEVRDTNKKIEAAIKAQSSLTKNVKKLQEEFDKTADAVIKTDIAAKLITAKDKLAAVSTSLSALDKQLNNLQTNLTTKKTESQAASNAATNTQPNPADSDKGTGKSDKKSTGDKSTHASNNNSQKESSYSEAQAKELAALEKNIADTTKIVAKTNRELTAATKAYNTFLKTQKDNAEDLQRQGLITDVQAKRLTKAKTSTEIAAALPASYKEAIEKGITKLSSVRSVLDLQKAAQDNAILAHDKFKRSIDADYNAKRLQDEAIIAKASNKIKEDALFEVEQHRKNVDDKEKQRQQEAEAAELRRQEKEKQKQLREQQQEANKRAREDKQVAATLRKNEQIAKSLSLTPLKQDLGELNREIAKTKDLKKAQEDALTGKYQALRANREGLSLEDSFALRSKASAISHFNELKNLNADIQETTNRLNNLRKIKSSTLERVDEIKFDTDPQSKAAQAQSRAIEAHNNALQLNKKLSKEYLANMHAINSQADAEAQALLKNTKDRIKAMRQDTSLTGDHLKYRTEKMAAVNEASESLGYIRNKQARELETLAQAASIAGDENAAAIHQQAVAARIKSDKTQIASARRDEVTNAALEREKAAYDHLQRTHYSKYNNIFKNIGDIDKTSQFLEGGNINARLQTKAEFEKFLRGSNSPVPVNSLTGQKDEAWINAWLKHQETQVGEALKEQEKLRTVKAKSKEYGGIVQSNMDAVAEIAGNVTTPITKKGSLFSGLFSKKIKTSEQPQVEAGSFTPPPPIKPPAGLLNQADIPDFNSGKSGQNAGKSSFMINARSLSTITPSTQLRLEGGLFRREIDKLNTFVSNQANNPFTKFAGQVEKALVGQKGFVSEFVTTFARASKVAAAYATVYTAFEIGARGFKLAAEFEQTTIAFESLFGSAKEGKKVLSELVDFAAKTPFQLPELEQATKTMKAMGIATEDLGKYLKILGNVSSGTGADMTTLGRILGRAKAEDRIMSKELNQLTDRGVPIFAALATQLSKERAITGTTAKDKAPVAVGQVIDFAEKGKISFKTFEAALISLQEKGGPFYDLMGKQAQTLGGKMSTLKDTFDIFLREAITPFLPGLKSLAEGLMSLMATFTSFITNVRLIGNAFSDAWVSLSMFAVALVSLNFTGIIASLGSLWAALGAVISRLAIMPILAMVDKAFQGLAATINIFRAALGMLDAQGKRVIVTTTTLNIAIKSLLGPLALIGVAIWAVYEVLQYYVSEANAAAKMTDEVALSATKEVTTMQELFRVMTDMAHTYTERADAMQKINESYAEYLPFLVQEGDSLKTLALLQQEVTDAIWDTYLAKEATKRLEEHNAKIMQKQINLTKLVSETDEISAKRKVDYTNRRVALDQRGRDLLTLGDLGAQLDNVDNELVKSKKLRADAASKETLNGLQQSRKSQAEQLLIEQRRLKELETQATKYENQTQAQKEAQAPLTGKQKERNLAAIAKQKENIAAREATLKNIEERIITGNSDNIEKVDDEIKRLEEAKEQLKKGTTDPAIKKRAADGYKALKGLEYSTLTFFSDIAKIDNALFDLNAAYEERAKDINMVMITSQHYGADKAKNKKVADIPFNKDDGKDKKHYVTPPDLNIPEIEAKLEPMRNATHAARELGKQLDYVYMKRHFQNDPFLESIDPEYIVKITETESKLADTRREIEKEIEEDNQRHIHAIEDLQSQRENATASLLKQVDKADMKIFLSQMYSPSGLNPMMTLKYKHLLSDQTLNAAMLKVEKNYQEERAKIEKTAFDQSVARMEVSYRKQIDMLEIFVEQQRKVLREQTDANRESRLGFKEKELTEYYDNFTNSKASVRMRAAYEESKVIKDLVEHNKNLIKLQEVETVMSTELTALAAERARYPSDSNSPTGSTRLDDRDFNIKSAELESIQNEIKIAQEKISGLNTKKLYMGVDVQMKLNKLEYEEFIDQINTTLQDKLMYLDNNFMNENVVFTIGDNTVNFMKKYKDTLPGQKYAAERENLVGHGTALDKLIADNAQALDTLGRNHSPYNSPEDDPEYVATLKRQEELLKLKDKNEKDIATLDATNRSNIIDRTRQQYLETVEGIGKVADAAMNGLAAIYQAQTELISQQITKQQRIVDTARENALKSRARGDAEQLQLEEKRLDDLERMKRNAVESQKELAYAQIAINTAVAISSIIAREALSPVGSITAPFEIAALLATMAFGFVAAKAQAEAAVASFMMGGYTGNKNIHGFANDPYPNDVAGTVHTKEFVFDRTTTAKHLDVFKRIHSGDLDLSRELEKANMFDSGYTPYGADYISYIDTVNGLMDMFGMAKLPYPATYAEKLSPINAPIVSINAPGGILSTKMDLAPKANVSDVAAIAAKAAESKIQAFDFQAALRKLHGNDNDFSAKLKQSERIINIQNQLAGLQLSYRHDMRDVLSYKHVETQNYKNLEDKLDKVVEAIKAQDRLQLNIDEDGISAITSRKIDRLERIKKVAQ